MRTLAAFSLCIALMAHAGTPRRRSVQHPKPPDGPCRFQGLANFYHSSDGGVTWSQNAAAPTAARAWDIGVVDADTLVVVVGRDIYDSTDAGCTWTLRSTITEQIKHTVHVVPGSDARAFIWTEEFVLRYDRGTVTPLTLPQRIGGLGVDPANSQHVHVLDLLSGVARESFDAGSTWQAIAGAPAGPILSAAYDPSDFRHILAGTMTAGIRVSRDGGRSWTAGAARQPCTLAFVASQPNVVWMTVPTQAGQPLIQRSANGGTSFEPIAGIAGLEDNVCLPVLAHPHDPNVAFIAFRGLYTIDAARRSVTTPICCGGQVDRIAFSPTDPLRMYIYAGQR